MIFSQIYPSSTINILFQALIYFILIIVFSIFSPFGMGFAIFSIIRAKAKSKTLKIISLIFQIFLTALTFIIGLVIAILFSLYSYAYSYSIIISITIILGSLFVLSIETAIIIWESFWLKKNK